MIKQSQKELDVFEFSCLQRDERVFACYESSF